MKHIKNYNSIDIFRLVFGLVLVLGIIVLSMAIKVLVHIINNGATF
jgi:hypothetical protein